MITLPQLHRMEIKTIHAETEVQIISLQPNKDAKLLVFDHLVRNQAFQRFQVSQLSSFLFALVYELPNTKVTASSIEKIESQLKNKKGEYEVGVFHEPFSNFDKLFVIVHRDYPLKFGVVFKSAKLAIFRLSYQKLFGCDSEMFIMYLTELSRANCLLREMNLNYKKEFRQIQSEIDFIKSKIELIGDKNREDKKKCVTVQNIIRKLSLDIQYTSDKHVLDCENCQLERKNVIFLPCGDIIHCKNCITLHFKIPLATRLKVCLFKCPRCRNLINEAREVFY